MGTLYNYMYVIMNLMLFKIPNKYIPTYSFYNVTFFISVN